MHNAVLNHLSKKKQYNYPLFFLGLYITCLLATVCLASRIIVINSILEPGGIFIFPFTFTICDIVGEVYGYAYSRLFIWIGAMAEIFFSLAVLITSHLPYPSFFSQAEAYQIVFDPTLRYVVGLLGLLVGEFANIYILAKWKIFLKGKFFIFRSLFSTAFGQFCLTIIVNLLNYSGNLSKSDLSWMMMCCFLWKMGYALIVAFPAWLLVKYLKKIENVDYYDLHTNFSPFIFNLNEQEFSSNPINEINIQLSSVREYQESDQ